jgi:mannosyltransferase OCH1-like enzyme
MIPKIIWQTHENKYEDLDSFQKNIINTWKNLNPGWKHNYIDAEQRSKDVKEYDDFLYECYRKSSGINQADIWRLVAIYNNGGFYADMDSICTMPLDDILHQFYNGEDMICSPISYQSDGVNNSNFAGLKNSKIAKLMLDKIIQNYTTIKEHFGIDISDLGPGDPCNDIFSKIAIKNKNLVCFNNKYFSHSSDYKTSFYKDCKVTYKKKETTYFNLAQINDWKIY